jgi:putative lipoprotein
MLGRLLLALPLLAVGLPAFGQTQLAQQCAAFGEAQYRKLSPSIDRITALDFPPPALERVEAKAGAQAVSAALTVRGKLTFRNGPPFETHFVCLLDAQHRPLFFYALPALATRSTPTPVTRGGTPAPAPPASDTPTLPLGQAPPSSEPARPALPASAVRLRGLVRDLGGRLQLLPCDGAPLTLEDRTPEQELTRALRELTAGKEGRPMFVELYGSREVGLGAGIAALELRRASVETAGCRERFDHREWIGVGNDPAWRLEVTSRDMVIGLLGGQPAQRVTHGGPQRQDGTIVYASVDGSEPVVLISEQRCADTQSGSLFAYSVQIRIEGRTFVGCMAHNPGMPAP